VVAVIRPLAFTVITDGALDVQAASLVTVRLVPSDMCAVATNCADSPGGIASGPANSSLVTNVAGGGDGCPDGSVGEVGGLSHATNGARRTRLIIAGATR
jgi:hypothetical protein